MYLHILCCCCCCCRVCIDFYINIFIYYSTYFITFVYILYKCINLHVSFYFVVYLLIEHYLYYFIFIYYLFQTQREQRQH